MPLGQPWITALKLAAVVLLAMSVYAKGRVDGAGRVQAQWQASRIEQVAAAAAVDKVHRAREGALIERLRKAEHDANLRDIQSREDAAAVAAVAVSLRRDIARLKSRLPEVSADASRAAAVTAVDLLGDCADDYRAMAEIAERHASDVRTLTEAWPVE